GGGRRAELLLRLARAGAPGQLRRPQAGPRPARGGRGRRGARGAGRRRRAGRFLLLWRDLTVHAERALRAAQSDDDHHHPGGDGGVSSRHSLLARQIRRHFGSAEKVPADLLPFLDAVDAAYRQSDDDRAMLERSMDLSSQELMQANAALRQSLSLVQATLE